MFSSLGSKKSNVEIELEPVPSTELIQKSDVSQLPDWRPWTMKAPFFVGAATLTLIHSAFCAVVIILNYQKSSFLSFEPENGGSYIFWQYLPMVLAVGPGLLWEMAYIATCRLQPYQDLATPNGSTLKDCLSQDYLTSFSWFVPYRAFTHANKHFGLGLICITYLLSYGGLPAATAAMVKITRKTENDPITVEPQIYFIVLALAISASASVFAAIAYLVLRRHKTGLLGDPASMAGIGALIARSDVLAKFQTVRSYDTQEQIDRAIGSYRIYLDYNPEQHHSLKIALLDPSQRVPDLPEPRFMQSSNEAHSWWLRGRTYIFLTIAQFIPHIYIRFATTDVTTTPNPFIIKICYTIINVIGAAIWANWHTNVSVLEPFYRLSTHKAGIVQGSSHALNVDFTGSAISDFFRAMRKGSRSLTVWWISTCALFVQLIVIVNPAASNLSGLQLNSFDDGISTQLILFPLLGFLLVALFFLLVGLIIMMKSRRRPFLPRKPYTLSSTILYLCHSEGLLEDVQDMSSLSKEVRDRRLTQTQNKYGFGWIENEYTGQAFVAIEKTDRIKRPFKFTKDYTKNAPNLR